jgi:hypothetical protein
VLLAKEGKRVTIEVIGKFGVKNGVQTYRINGSYDDLYTLIAECRLNNIEFDDIPIVNPLRKNQWTMLLKIRVHTMEVGECDTDT